jgi:hypothetical protein
MIRLFLKLYGLLIATLVFSFVVQMQLMEYVYKEMASGFDFRQRFMATFHLIEEALAPLAAGPVAGPLPGACARLSPTPARLGRVEALPERARLKPDQRQGMDSGSIVTIEREGGGLHAREAPARQRVRRGARSSRAPTTSASASRPTWSTGAPSS